MPSLLDGLAEKWGIDDVAQAEKLRAFRQSMQMRPVIEPPQAFGEAAQAAQRKLNRSGFTGGQNSRRLARYGTDIKEEDIEAVFT